MGVIVAFIIFSLWALHLLYSLAFVTVNFTNPIFYVHLIIQAYLYTGLFITGHDAMHGVVSKSKIINKWVGTIAAFLFAGLSYKKLVKNHFAHHRFPGTEKDPDYSSKSQNFFWWYFTFMFRYATILQIIIMGIIFNLLKVWFAEINIWFFWVVPAFLGSLQLFFFGTYLPHKKPHLDEMEPHKARSLKKNHLWAMLSCYFFGYHYEHHAKPNIPWWQLYKTK